ncbi:flagellar hook-associated protein FlgK [Halomonas vilamensis]|uniref:Flagellar hook-associated protein 1 n=1 Tax=Vreelandella vilamensis TaxID=531309 RepID=A0ABU1H3R4_9GAMM|nr:flagellar hook-associated protein FlgK [Halomonas vilamensis]MDR5898750.1 flagellar hook-associated protein FlgK [Halomonas vilamensis]
MSMFSIGLSGLNTAQSALNTTSNNISNVYTPGYNRELPKLNEASGGTGGVQVSDTERQFNRYVADQLNSAKTQSSALQKYSEQVTQIDNLLADRDAGLAPLMQNFFSSLEDMASAPSDPASRQGVLGTAQTLSAQFRSFDGYLQDMQSNIKSEIQDEVTQINNTTKQIAGLNREIALSRAQNGEAPNSILNQRDHLISELNERMDVRLNIQDGKTYNVSLPNGQPLVTGKDSFQLEPVQSQNDPQRIVVGYSDGRGNVVELKEDLITGGALGGLMSFRQETLDKTQNQIGQLAVSLSIAFNEQHKQGVDLNGDQGEDFFNVRQPQAYSYQGNTADVDNIRFNTGGIDDLRATDYTVTFDGSGPTVTRNDNGSEVDIEWDNTTLSFGGVSMEFDAAPTNGDTFEIQPVRRAGAGMESNIADLDKIAAGKLVESEENTAISLVGVDTGAFSDGEAYNITLDGSGQLTFSGAAGYTQPTDIIVNGNTRSVDGSGMVSGLLNAGDKLEIDGVGFSIDEILSTGSGEFVFEKSDANSGDNRNALALQNLQSQNVVGGSASVSGAYGAMVSDVGNRTNITQVNLDARQGLTDQLEAVQQSESGVNLDEEAANLIRYQQYYQANAKVIDTATTIMDTILGLRG